MDNQLRLGCADIRELAGGAPNKSGEKGNRLGKAIAREDLGDLGGSRGTI